MKTLRLFILALFLIFAPVLSLHAEVLVLVHGWAATAETWIRSGVVPVLVNHGWQDAGVVKSSAVGVQFYQVAHPYSSSHHLYRVELPGAAPLLLQASHLTSQLSFIQRMHPDEDMIIAGHSAGGVVARLVAIRPDFVKIKSLITIASPHLGTPRALDGLDIVDSKPFFCPGPGIDFLKTMIGGSDYQYLKDSRRAMIDLAPVASGSLLDWLNRQVHPNIQYHALIRTGYDDLVPTASQDLNRIPVLRGRVHVYTTPATHELNPADGKLIADIISNNR